MTDMSARMVTERLRLAAEHCGLRAETRLRYKLDMTPAGIARRLEKVEALRRFCVELARIGERNGLGRRVAARPPG